MIENKSRRIEKEVEIKMEDMYYFERMENIANTISIYHNRPLTDWEQNIFCLPRKKNV